MKIHLVRKFCCSYAIYLRFDGLARIMGKKEKRSKSSYFYQLHRHYGKKRA